MARTQLHRFLSIGTPLGDDVLLVSRVNITEELGRPFRMYVEMVSETDDISPDDLIGQNITVRVDTRRETPRYFNGIVSSFGQRPAEGRLASYAAEVVPWFWLLSQTSDCRIFQHKTVPAIIAQIFRESGFTDFQENLTGKYREWEYCVQYRETDFSFVSRLMEQEGIYCFFAHDNGKHTMVLCDGPPAHEAFPGYEQITFRAPAKGTSDQEHIRHWAFEEQLSPGVYAHTDFDFRNPRKWLLATAKIERRHLASEFEVYDYPGEFVEFREGEAYARARIEELQARHEVGRGHSDARGICVGSTFELAEHPLGSQCREYLIISSSTTFQSDVFDSTPEAGGHGPTCRCNFMAIPAAERFRTERTTPRPEVKGPQTAIVCGPKGEEIYTDKYGRVKVQFHWDRYSKGDENSSCWIRVSEGLAGKRWGSICLPRIGQEVIVDFLEGDPDHPIVTGRVYNGEKMPPYTLPAHKTIATTKTNSSKGGQGFNEVRFEDKKGEEQVFVHAEKNLDTRVKNDSFEWIGNNRHLIIKEKQFEHVEANRHELVDLDHLEEIGKDRSLKVKGKEAKEVIGSLSLTVGGDVVEVFKSNHAESTTQTISLKGMSVRVEASTGIELKCGGSSIVLTPAAIFIMGGPMVSINTAPGPPVPPVMAQAVSPGMPAEAEPADDADPGAMDEVKARQQETKSGKYGSTKVKSLKPAEGDEQTQHWIEIELVDEDGNPVPGERYRITLPDGETVAEGTLDNEGLAHVGGIPNPGTCQITFPDLDQDAWEKA